MQVFGEWMAEWRRQQEVDLREVSERMKEAFVEAERRYKEAQVARMLEEAAERDGGD